MNDFKEEYEFMQKIHGVNDFEGSLRKKKNIDPFFIDTSEGFGSIFNRSGGSVRSQKIEKKNMNENIVENKGEKDQKEEKNEIGKKEHEKKENEDKRKKKKTGEDAKHNLVESIFKDFLEKKGQSLDVSPWSEYKKKLWEEDMQNEYIATYGRSPMKCFEKEESEEIDFVQQYPQYETLVKDKFTKFRKGELSPVREGLMKPGIQFDKEMHLQNLFQVEHLKHKCGKEINHFANGIQKMKHNVNELATCDEVVYYIHANNINLYEYINHHIDLDKYYMQVKEIPKHLFRDYEDDHERYIYLNDDVFFKARKHVQKIKGAFLSNREQERRETGTNAGANIGIGTGTEKKNEGKEKEKLDAGDKNNVEKMEKAARKHIDREKHLENMKGTIQDMFEKKNILFGFTDENSAIIGNMGKTEQISSCVGNYLFYLKWGLQAIWHLFSTILHYDYTEYPYIRRYAMYDCFENNVKQYMKHFETKDEDIVVDKQFILRNRYLTPFFIHNTMDVNYNVNENGIVVLSSILPFVHNFEADCKLKQIREKEKALERELRGGIERGKRNPIIRCIMNVKSFFLNTVLKKFLKEEEEGTNMNKSESFDCAKFLKKFESNINDEGEFTQDIIFPGKVQMIFFNFNSKQFDSKHFDPTAQLEQSIDQIKTHKIILGFDKKEHVQYSNILVSNVLKSIKKKHPNMFIDDNNPKQHIQYMYFNRWNFFSRNEDPYWKGGGEEETEGEDGSFVGVMREEAWGGLMKFPLGYHNNSTTNHLNISGPFSRNIPERMSLQQKRIKGIEKTKEKHIPLSELVDYLCYSPDQLLKKKNFTCEYVTCVSFDNSAGNCNLINNFVLGYNTGKVEYIYGKMDYENMNHCDLLVDYYMNKNKKFTYELNKRFYLDGGVIKITFAPNGFYCLILTYNTLYICSFFYASLCDIGMEIYAKSSIVNILWMNNNCYAIFCSKGSVHIYERTAKSDTVNGFALTKSYFLNQPIYLNSVCFYHAYNNCIYLYTGEVEKKKMEKIGIFSRGLLRDIWGLKKKRKRKKKKDEVEVAAVAVEEMSSNNFWNKKVKEKKCSFEEELRREVKKEEMGEWKTREEKIKKDAGEVNAEIKKNDIGFERKVYKDRIENAHNFLKETKYEKLKKTKPSNREKGSRKNYFYKFEGNLLMIDLDGDAEKKYVRHFYNNLMYNNENEMKNKNTNMNVDSLDEDIGSITMDCVSDLNLLLRHVNVLEKSLLLENNEEEEYDFQFETHMPTGLKEFNAYISGLKGLNEHLNNHYGKELGLFKEDRIEVKGREQGKEYDLSCFRERKKISMFAFLRNYVKEVRNYLYNMRNENILNILLPRFYSTDMEMNYNNFLNVRYFCLDSECGNHLIALDAQTDCVYIYEIKKNVYIENELLERVDRSMRARDKLSQMFDCISVEEKNLKPYWKIFENFIYINTKTNLRYIKFNLLYIIRNEKKLYFPLHVQVVDPKMECEEYYILIKWATISNMYVSSSYNSLNKISKKGRFKIEEGNNILKALEEQKDVYVLDSQLDEDSAKKIEERSLSDWLRLSDQQDAIKVETVGGGSVKTDIYRSEKKEKKFGVPGIYKEEESEVDKIKKIVHPVYDISVKSKEKEAGYSKQKLTNLLKNTSRTGYPQESTVENGRRHSPSWENEIRTDGNIISDQMRYSNYANYPHFTSQSNKFFGSRNVSPNRDLSYEEKMKNYLMDEQKGLYDRHRDYGDYRSGSFSRRRGTVLEEGYGSERERERGYYYSGMMNEPDRARSEYQYHMGMGNKESYFKSAPRNMDWNVLNEKRPMFYNTERERIYFPPPSPKKSRFSFLLNALKSLKPSDGLQTKRIGEYTTKDDSCIRNLFQGNKTNYNRHNDYNPIFMQQGNPDQQYYNKNYVPPMSDVSLKENKLNFVPEKNSNFLDKEPSFNYRNTKDAAASVNATTTTPLYDINNRTDRYEAVRNRRLTGNIFDPTYQRGY